MILPAVVMKVIGFKDNQGNFYKEVNEKTNIIRCQLDDLSIIDVSMYGNDKNFNSLNDYLHNKAQTNVKENKIKSFVSDLMFDENGVYSEEVENLKETVLDEKKNGANIKNVSQEIFRRLASNIIYENSRIKQSSIIRMALAQAQDGTFNSRSIISGQNKEGDTVYKTTGIYQHAMSSNYIPIEIKRVLKNDLPLDFHQVQTSDLINLSQVNELLSHCIRTIQQTLNKPFLIKFQYKQDLDQELKNVIINYNTFIKDNKNNPVNGNTAIELIKNIQSLINEDPRRLLNLKFILPILINHKDLVNGISTVSEDKGKSPIQAMRNSMVDLNFSTENPDRKDCLKKYILNEYFRPLIHDSFFPTLLTTYNIIAPNVFGESDSWGFMLNNVDFSKITININNQRRILNSLPEQC